MNKNRLNRERIREMTTISVLASLIIVTGMIKVPSPIPGSDFQLSAPLAVGIAVVYGFRKYIIAGILASSILLMLGFHTILNVEISMVFRIVAGGAVALFGPSIPVVVLAGPLGSIAARFVLAETLQVSVWPLLAAALPGILFAAITVLPVTSLLKRIKVEGNKQYAR
ncbi:hypothetical protein [Alkalihalobacillus sp. CinArs1]|uniref:hypothetical protein n=1 Tax=Alkalihalobacillus sp. CinArs1 TaxID=2995314 RepID=UPI0022DDB89F|nr:hypothetical protein [Alkalihalobacillus sp. CinArs1]